MKRFVQSVMQWPHVLARWVRRRRVIWAMASALLLGFGGVLATAVPTDAASTYSVIFARNPWWTTLWTIYLYYGQQKSLQYANGWGWIHIHTVHDYKDSLARAIQDVIYEPGQLTHNAQGTYYYFAADFSPANDLNDTVTLFVVVKVNTVTHQWNVHTAYPLPEGVTQNGIHSDTNIPLERGSWPLRQGGYRSETGFPEWLNNPADFFFW